METCDVTNTPTTRELVQAAWDADDAWQRELVRVYGNRASHARYAPDSTYTDPLVIETKKTRDGALRTMLARLESDRKAGL